ncbi:MAG: glycogen debranching protein GlgX [Pseudomonadota bacterium]
MESLAAGKAYPLGAHADQGGVNFALVAPHAEAATLCLFDAGGAHELKRLAMPQCEDGVWHGYLAGAAPGLVYGYRVSGPYAPQLGHRFNPHKVLLDPYAREIVGVYLGQPEFIGGAIDPVDASHRIDSFDNAALALKARVTDNGIGKPYDWANDQPPQIPLAQTILYEMHVKGISALHPDVPEELRGTYAGLAHPAVLAYIKSLGVTSVSLLPVHARADEARLRPYGLSNYWGYSSIGFFAPEPRYWSGRAGSTPASEFRDMVKALHRTGLEVILDVVYNHTGEMDEFGPTISFRGIDNALYYHLEPGNPALYPNWSGCGNCLNLGQPRVLQLVMDSLRFWVEEMHVDGFRFDLAPVLARGADGFSTSAAFFAAVRQDPVLARIKLIAEPWDIGSGGYQVGQFPLGWLEWNDQFRDTMRAFWLHQWPTLGEFARRFSGSSDLFHHDGRLPTASVNFITAHDGFTLRDLVSYNHKHNAANGEQNRDGQHHNHSWNCGVEGVSKSSEVLQLRARLQRALLATLFFAQGTPMLLAGDEISHTQHGNNNAYCQDNRLTWLDWARADDGLCAYVQRLIVLRQQYAVLRHANWYEGASDANDTAGYPDIAWLSPAGGSMPVVDWENKDNYCIGIRLQGSKEAALLLINAQAQEADFVLPAGRWRVILDSANPDAAAHEIRAQTVVPARALWLAMLEQ